MALSVFWELHLSYLIKGIRGDPIDKEMESHFVMESYDEQVVYQVKIHQKYCKRIKA
jgi:hypothetical protein